MDNETKFNTADLDLDAILSEFQGTPESGEEPAAEVQDEALQQQLSELSDLLDTMPQALPTVTLPVIPEEAPETSEASETSEADPAASQAATVRFEAIGSKAESSEEASAEEAVTTDATVRLDPVQLEEVSLEDLEREVIASMAQDTPEEAPQPICFSKNPRARLREMKKKLVAGPEKRYYELTEIGLGRVQAAFFLNLIMAGICILLTTLYGFHLIPAARLRFVIFSQILAMLVSALLGCNQMLDGLGELLKGRFTLNTLLSVTFAACCADAVFCLSELRVPCCAAFSLEVSMALWARFQKRSTETDQMDTLRKAVKLHGMVRTYDYCEGKDAFLTRDADPDEFMHTYAAPSGPERVQSIYGIFALLGCVAVAVLAGMGHGISMALQILSASLLVAVPATFFVSLSRPAHILQKRLHMVGTVLCGWQGVRGFRGKVAYPVTEQDLFPHGSTKFNGVKFYGDRESDEVVSFATSLIVASGSGLTPAFRQMCAGRGCREYDVENFRRYDQGIGCEIGGESVLMGTSQFLQDMGVEIPGGTMVAQAVYTAVDGQLSAVFAISYARMRSSAAGIVSLCGSRKITPVLLGGDFMFTRDLIRSKFGVSTRRMVFPDRETEGRLLSRQPDADSPVLAIATRSDLASFAYALTGARALRTAARLGTVVHVAGGILGLLIMAALAYLGNTELLTPVNILLYQLVWGIPGLLITEWTRTV